MPENRTKTGQFAKGKSGNPGGRPKYPKDIKALIQENTVKAAQTIIDLMDSDNEKVALQAAVVILDRALGKPATAGKVELSHSGDVGLDITAQIHAAILKYAEEERRLEARGEQTL